MKTVRSLQGMLVSCLELKPSVNPFDRKRNHSTAPLHEQGLSVVMATLLAGVWTFWKFIEPAVWTVLA